MPSSTERQRRFIFAKRRRYGTRARTPDRWRWVWGKEWERLAEGRIVGPRQHALLEAAEADPGYAPHTGGDFDFIVLASRATEPLTRYDRRVISAAMAECFDYHRISTVMYRPWSSTYGRIDGRHYEVWFSNLGTHMKEFWMSKTEDDWFWVSFRFSAHQDKGSVLQMMPRQWKCDGPRGVANLIRDVAKPSI